MRVSPLRALVASFYHNPVFVLGAGRSGTAVVKRALGMHPRVLACDGEAPFVAEVASLIAPFQVGRNPDYQRRALRFSTRELEARLRDLCFEAAMGSHLGARRLAREVVRSRKRPRQLRYWCAKTFPDRAQAEAIKIVYPSCRFVYVVRNGCEVVRSRMRFESMKHRSFEQHCEDWASDAVKYDYIRGEPRAMMIRHERLIEDPDRVFADIWRLLELPAADSAAIFAKTTLVHPLDEPTRAGIDVRNELDARGAAHSGWSTTQKETFKKICREAMEVLGYEIPF